MNRICDRANSNPTFSADWAYLTLDSRSQLVRWGIFDITKPPDTFGTQYANFTRSWTELISLSIGLLLCVLFVAARKLSVLSAIFAHVFASESERCRETSSSTIGRLYRSGVTPHICSVSSVGLGYCVLETLNMRAVRCLLAQKMISYDGYARIDLGTNFSCCWTEKGDIDYAAKCLVIDSYNRSHANGLIIQVLQYAELGTLHYEDAARHH